MIYISHYCHTDSSFEFFSPDFIISPDLQSGLPFARLKLKPVQRLSCMLDYEVAAGPEVEAGTERRNKRISRAGLALGLGGKCQTTNNLGQCFLCPEPATTQVTVASLHTAVTVVCSVILSTGWASGLPIDVLI